MIVQVGVHLFVLCAVLCMYMYMYMYIGVDSNTYVCMYM